MLDRLHLGAPPQKIQPRPIPPRRRTRKGKIWNGYHLPALQAITAARGFIAGQFPTLAIAALCCGSSRGSVAAAVAIIKTEDSVLLADVLTSRKPLLATARSIKHAIELVDAFRKSSNAELRIFGHVITPETLFETVVAAL